MDSTFKVPKIPLVSANTLTASTKKAEVTRKVSKSKSLPLKPANRQLLSTQNNKINSTSVHNHVSIESNAKQSKSMANTPQVIDLQPIETFPKLCPSCSQILVKYLSPIENYLKNLIIKADTVSNQSTPVSNITLSTFESALDGQSKQSGKQQVVQKQETVSSLGVQRQQHSNYSNGAPVTADAVHIAQKNSAPAFSAAEENQNVPQPCNINEYRDVSSKPVLNSKQNNHSNVVGVTNTEGQANHKQSAQQRNADHHVSGEQQVQQPTSGKNEFHYETQHNRGGHRLPEENQALSEPIQYINAKSSEIMAENVSSSGAKANHNRSPTGPTSQSVQVKENWQIKAHAMPSSSVDVHQEIVNRQQEATMDAVVESDTVPDQEEWNEVENSPYAYVTIAYDNLSTVNAILLANSIQLYNNKVLNILEDNEYSSKKITDRYHIPTVILLCDSIDRTLRQVAYQVFDKVIESKYQDAVLLNDERLGIQQYKIHLWKELAFQYEKCIFFESFTLVVGNVSNLLVDCQELSASVDCFVPDNFNCSVFVFEPNMATYSGLLSLGLQLKLKEANENDFEMDTLDEMTLLNQFFAPKWRKLSFIYNFVRNDLTYTQVPAYCKFGDNIRVVNFGSAGQQSLEPWNVQFDLNKAQLEAEPFENAPVDNYFKFYLRCFVRRVWPLLSQTITPYLLAHHNGRTEWTVFELVQILGRQSGEGFAQNPVTMSRKKSWAIDPSLQLQLTEEIEPEVEPESAVQQISHSASPPVEDAPSDDKEKLENCESAAEQQANNRQKQNEENKRQWEDGRVDWMGSHQSDRIINRLKNLIQ